MIEDGSGQPVRRARVSVRATDARFDRAVMTDDAGRFVVSSVPPGRYSIIVTKPSYIAGYHGSKRPGRGPGTAIAVTAGQKAQVSITMARGAVITGVVRDESGAPMPNARVTAGIIRVQNGLRDIYQLGSAQTDDRGAYRIFNLAANNYYVFAVPSISTHGRAAAHQRRLAGGHQRAASDGSAGARRGRRRPHAARTPGRFRADLLSGHAVVRGRHGNPRRRPARK